MGRVSFKNSLQVQTLKTHFAYDTGLFTADQALVGDTSLYTRQNAAGTRYGFEIPEERDYYPYWGPTPWKDIAIMVSDYQTKVSMEEYVNRTDYGHKCEFYFKLFVMLLYHFLLLSFRRCVKAWPIEVASRRMLKMWVYLRLRLPRPCVYFRWLVMTCTHCGRDEICTQVKAIFLSFGYPIQVKAG